MLSGRAKLEEIIKDAVPDLDYAPSNLYVDLMQLPWVDVFTTNYDTLLERTLENVVNRSLVCILLLVSILVLKKFLKRT